MLLCFYAFTLLLFYSFMLLLFYSFTLFLLLSLLLSSSSSSSSSFSFLCAGETFITRCSGATGTFKCEILRDGLRSLWYTMYRKFSFNNEPTCSLNLSWAYGSLLVVSGELGSLYRNSVEDIVHERVQDGDTSLGDTSLWVNLLQHLVDVGRVGLNSLLDVATSLLGGIEWFLSGHLWYSDWGVRS